MTTAVPVGLQALSRHRGLSLASPCLVVTLADPTRSTTVPHGGPESASGKPETQTGQGPSLLPDSTFHTHLGTAQDPALSHSASSSPLKASAPTFLAFPVPALFQGALVAHTPAPRSLSSAWSPLIPTSAWLSSPSFESAETCPSSRDVFGHFP